MKVFGLFGEKLSHSLSPTIHNMLYQALGIEAAYSLFEIEPHMLQDAVKGIWTLNINGVNVTIPYKLKVMEYIDNVSDEALRIGAVNTIYNNNNRLIGYNTDYTGFGRMLTRNSIEIKNKTAVILGTGGAAKAVITYLEDHNISKTYIVSRNPEDVNSFDSLHYEIIDYNKLYQLKQTDLLINCTPCGMHPKIDCSPIEEITVSNFSTVIDLIYNPGETLLLNYARRNNLIAVNGLYMLVAQAAAAVEIWTGQIIDDNIIENVYLKLKQRFV